MRAPLWVLLLASSCVTPRPAPPEATAPAPSPRNAGEALRQLFAAEWDRELSLNPVRASALGDRRWNDRLGDNSLGAVEQQKAHTRALLVRMERFDRTGLSGADLLDLELFTRRLRVEVASHRFPEEVLLMTSHRGPHTLVPQLAEQVPLAVERDYEDFLSRLRQAPAWFDNVIARLQRGIDLGVLPPRIAVRNVADSIALQFPADVKSSPGYLRAFSRRPMAVSPERWAELQRRGEQTIAEHVYPSLRKLHAFWVQTYFPRTGEEVGLSALPDGAAWYAHRVRLMTTTELTPDEIHALGLSEVRRLREEMEKVKQEAKFKGSLSQFFHFMRTDPRFFHTEREQLLSSYREISKRIDGHLPKLFRTLPRLPYGVEMVPAYAERNTTTAYYSSGSLEAGRAGIFYANTYDLKSRPKWEMEALTAHEAMPGHHLQIALAQELEDLPMFRRHGGYTAYVEGWALYSESLGGELGLYADPYARFGQLSYEMWRAIRLVLDTGLHTRGWTRDQAIRFFSENSPKPLHDIEVEVDRYITWPGQAVAYKVGELRIKALRAFAEQAQGDRFDLRAFHHLVLASGPLPLDLLEEQVKAAIRQEAPSATRARR